MSIYWEVYILYEWNSINRDVKQAIIINKQTNNLYSLCYSVYLYVVEWTSTCRHRKWCNESGKAYIVYYMQIYSMFYLNNNVLTRDQRSDNMPCDRSFYRHVCRSFAENLYFHQQHGEEHVKKLFSTAVIVNEDTHSNLVRGHCFRHGPFDILGGGAWDILEKNFLALILTKKNKLAHWHSEKNNLSPIV